MRKFNLGYGCLGNGTMVWNTLREVHGDYEKIAHITDLGEISYYQKNLPSQVKKQIEKHAKSHEFEYRGLIVRKNQVSVTQGYYYLLDPNTRELKGTYNMQNLGNKSTDHLMTDDQIKSQVDYYLPRLSKNK